MTNLEKRIIECNEAYKNGERLIDDTEYDALLEELRNIDPENELCSKVQMDTQMSKGSKKFEYGDNPMLSLNKVFSTEELIKWMRSVARSENELFLLQPKYDGLSGCIDGETKTFATRGNGEIGEVINSKIDMIKFDQWTLEQGSSDISSLSGYRADFSFPKNGDQIRGEIIIAKDVFEKLRIVIKKKDGETYKNPRNCVSGLMNPAMSEEDNAQLLKQLLENNIAISFISHDVISNSIALKDVTPERIEEVWSWYLSNVPYEQDGLVIKLADSEYAGSLGNTSHHPRGACALKRNKDGQWSKLIGIDWTVGMGGELTPTGVIEPLEIDGVTVSHVLLHNLQQIVDRRLQIGNEISLVLSGMIIPMWVDNQKSDVDISKLGLDYGEMTKTLRCPCCGSGVIYDFENSPDCYCSNDHCHDRVMKRLYNAVSKCFEIKGLAEETLKKIHMKFGVEKFYQLLDLEVEQLSTLPGFAMNSAEILYDSIQKARNASDVQVLASLGIRLIGRHVSKDILSLMPLSVLREASVASLVEIKTFGAEKAQSLTEGLKKYSNELDELIARIEVKQTFSVSKKAEVDGKPTICFTGEAPYPRSQCQELARKNGYEPISGVNKNLSVLVCADTDTNSTKAQKARKYGTKIVPFSEWFESLKDNDTIGTDAAKHGNAAVDSILEGL